MPPWPRAAVLPNAVGGPIASRRASEAGRSGRLAAASIASDLSEGSEGARTTATPGSTRAPPRTPHHGAAGDAAGSLPSSVRASASTRRPSSRAAELLERASQREQTAGGRVSRCSDAGAAAGGGRALEASEGERPPEWPPLRGSTDVAGGQLQGEWKAVDAARRELQDLAAGEQRRESTMTVYTAEF